MNTIPNSDNASLYGDAVSKNPELRDVLDRIKRNSHFFLLLLFICACSLAALLSMLSASLFSFGEYVEFLENIFMFTLFLSIIFGILFFCKTIELGQEYKNIVYQEKDGVVVKRIIASQRPYLDWYEPFFPDYRY